MKKMFKIKDSKLVDELYTKFGVVAHRNYEFLEIEPDMYNYSIMSIMEIISNNQKYEKTFSGWFDSMDRFHEMPDFLYGKHRAGGWEMYGSSINESIIMNYILTEIKQTQEKDIKSKEHLGIENINECYIETNELQEPKYEYRKIQKFLNLYKEEYAKIHNQNPNNIKIKFINYGKTELVFVLTDEKGEKSTLLVKQPKVEKIEIMQEIINLRELKKIDNNVIAPINVFDIYDQALYRTTYIYQARCIASDNTWGMYIPEPFYRFVPFTKEQESIVNTCMIAKIVSLYDFENGVGLAACKLGGGDFILPKGWEEENPTIKNTLNNLYLIAARKKVKCSFEEYIATIIDEFTRKTIDVDEKRLIINKRGRVPMNINDILNGIRLGKEIIKDRDGYTLKKK